LFKYRFVISLDGIAKANEWKDSARIILN
jgi:hypothetical protein